MSTTAEFRESDLQDFKKSMSECRSDDFDTNWVLLRHVDDSPNEITMAAFGNGGIEEMKGALEDTSVMYGLVKLCEQFDGSSVDRFVYIHWIGKDVPFTVKGKYGVVHGSIKKFIEPFHASFETDNKDDLAEDILMNKITETSGTKSKVLDSDVAAGRRADRGFTDAGKGLNQGTPRETRGFSGMKKEAKGGGTMKIDEAVFQDASNVRNDNSGTNWFVAGYQDGDPKKPLVSIGSGDDGFMGFKALLKDNMAGYVLFRVEDKVDDIATIKFAYIQWVGERVKPLAKAKISTHRSDLEQIFFPSHATIFVTSDLQEADIMDKIQSSSGSKSHVRNIER